MVQANLERLRVGWSDCYELAGKLTLTSSHDISALKKGETRLLFSAS